MSKFNVGDKVVLKDNIYSHYHDSDNYFFLPGVTGVVGEILHDEQVIAVRLDDPSAPDPADGTGEWAFLAGEIEHA